MGSVFRDKLVEIWPQEMPEKVIWVKKYNGKNWTWKRVATDQDKNTRIEFGPFRIFLLFTIYYNS